MSAQLIVPPVAMPVSIEAARRAARTSGTALDAELESKVRGITEEAEHETGRAFIEQVWALTLDAFPAGRQCAIQLAPARLIAVDHVKFYDAGGVQQVLHPADYQVDTKNEPGRLLLAPGLGWPATAVRIDAVEVQYRCGYGPTEASVPPAIKEYILGMLENDYYPNPNAKFLARRLDRATVYA